MCVIDDNEFGWFPWSTASSRAVSIQAPTSSRSARVVEESSRAVSAAIPAACRRDHSSASAGGQRASEHSRSAGKPQSLDPGGEQGRLPRASRGISKVTGDLVASSSRLYRRGGRRASRALPVHDENHRGVQALTASALQG